MRVIAGKYRHRALRAPRGLEVRPTSDRLRETLFNVLAAGRPEVLAGSVWIDAFAGTGAVGIEALSRGARQVYFLESAKAAAAAIRANLKALGIAQGAEIVEREAAAGLERLEAAGVECGFFFLDPPYRMEAAYHETLERLAKSKLLKTTSVVVAEHDQHFDPGDGFGRLSRYRKLEQGDAVLSFYKLVPGSQ
ncbi:MAG TPA: 16S rRNA (guanine(966)-N(2))-methyltransferase RsmD [Terriglobales bacterium]|nr:16S rRNA (guanine(966)-N(2))-methyltransferase RsmD [Terriglobales bacterium]